MANNNGIISAPGIGLEPDIYGTLGVGRQNGLFDTGYICCNIHGKINKRSKVKPVRYDVRGEITEAQMRNTDPANGIYWGLKMTDSVKELVRVHDCDFTYYPPRATDPQRMTDFNGYDHRAVFMPNAVPPSTVDISYSGACKIAATIYSWDGNGTGVSLRDLLSFDYDNMYPCILVSNLECTENYATALINKAAGVPTVMKYNNVWATNLETRSFVGRADFFHEEATRLVSLFFATKLQGTGMDLTQWEEVTGKQPGIDFLGCPEAVALEVPFVNYEEADFVDFSIVSANINPTGNQLFVLWRSSGEITSGHYYTYSVQIYRAAKGQPRETLPIATATKGFTYTGTNSGDVSDIMTLSASITASTAYDYTYEWQAACDGDRMSSGAGTITVNP